MASANVKVIGGWADGGPDLFSDEGCELEQIGDGVVTDEHVCCSYGQPVLTLAGEVYGPADVNAQRGGLGWQIVLAPDRGMGDAEAALVEAFVRLCSQARGTSSTHGTGWGDA